MTAVLLAAGKGTRLGNITDATPKPLLRIHGEPILEHLVKLCAAHGATTLCVNTHHLGEKIREALGNGTRFGLRIVYSHEAELLGTAGALQNFREHLHDDFLVIYGDNYMDYDLSAFLTRHRSSGGIGTVAFYEKEDVSHSGIAELGDDGRIVRFIEKPAPHEVISHYVNCGLYALSPRIFRYLPEGFSDFGRDIFPALLAQGEPLYGMIMDQPLIAIDTETMYRDAGATRES